MRFKSLLALVTLAACSTIFLLGCDALRGKPTADVIVAKPKEFECLKEWPAKAGAYLQDDLSESGTDFLFQCLTLSLDAFGRLTTGEDKTLYQDEELRYFFNRFLAQEHQVTPAFMSEIMKLKVVVLGGAPNSLTREELRLANQFIEVMHGQAQKIRGLQKLFYFQKDAADVGIHDILDSQSLFKDAVITILKNTKIARSSYEFSDLKSFLKELGNFIRENKLDPNDQNVIAKVDQWMPLVESLKTLFMGKNPNLSSWQEWKDATDWTMDAYFFSLKAYYHLQPMKLGSPAESLKVIGALDDGFLIIEKAPQLVDKSYLDAADIDRVIDQIDQLKSDKLPLPLDAELLKISYKRFLENMVDGVQRGRTQAYEMRGLEKRHLIILHHEYNVWKLVQLSLNRIYGSQIALTPEEFNYRSKYIFSDQIIDDLNVPTDQRQSFTDSWNEWKWVLATYPPIRMSQDNRLWLNFDFAKTNFDYRGVTSTSIFRSVARLLMRGYGQGGDSLPTEQMSLPRLMDLEKDFRSVGVALNLVAPGDTTAAARTFDQANMFTVHGNGDDQLSSVELLEMIHMMVAGGGGLAKKAFADLDVSQCRMPGVDGFGFNNLNTVCFKNYLRDHADDLFLSMPRFLKYIKSLNSRSYENFFNNLIVVAHNEKAPADATDFLTLRDSMMVIQYVESLLLMYDADGDGYLNEVETANAYPRFAKFILARPEMKGQDPIYGYYAFIAIVQTGEIPGELKLFWDRWKPWNDHFYIDRSQLLRVLAILKKSS